MPIRKSKQYDLGKQAILVEDTRKLRKLVRSRDAEKLKRLSQSISSYLLDKWFRLAIGGMGK
jgi:hypothetical protein